MASGSEDLVTVERKFEINGGSARITVQYETPLKKDSPLNFRCVLKKEDDLNRHFELSTSTSDIQATVTDLPEHVRILLEACPSLLLDCFEKSENVSVQLRESKHPNHFVVHVPVIVGTSTCNFTFALSERDDDDTLSTRDLYNLMKDVRTSLQSRIHELEKNTAALMDENSALKKTVHELQESTADRCFSGRTRSLWIDTPNGIAAQLTKANGNNDKHHALLHDILVENGDEWYKEGLQELTGTASKSETFRKVMKLPKSKPSDNFALVLFFRLFSILHGANPTSVKFCFQNTLPQLHPQQSVSMARLSFGHLRGIQILGEETRHEPFWKKATASFDERRHPCNTIEMEA
eukprot:CAMPEP_0119123174 /NCGR_PEP_ID=MMETSP1310-20130426/3203_1 /TAXON_ID=464262 /ORGANISM="Genus nov. species nov., Strain RCC2339" /LENGTH=350 /DNA_ID=CAMNT_0007112937 /DNA_START=66 /DNA_END=1115 /DNA_ORIENTATION=-